MLLHIHYLTQLCKVDAIIPILQMREVKLRRNNNSLKDTQLIWFEEDWKAELVAPEPFFLNIKLNGLPVKDSMLPKASPHDPIYTAVYELWMPFEVTVHGAHKETSSPPISIIYTDFLVFINYHLILVLCKFPSQITVKCRSCL